MAINKNVGGVEDLTWGMSQVKQLRRNSEVWITQINGLHIPYDFNQSITEKIQSMGGPGGQAPLESDIQYVVGPGGTFETINEALDYITRNYYQVHVQQGVKVDILLASGFVMAEQVLLNYIDLGWISISGEDSVTTITRSALTIGVIDPGTDDVYPAFCAGNNSVLPIINQMFTMDASGVATSREGVYLYGNSEAIIRESCGISNAGGNGLHVRQASSVDGRGSIFTGSGVSNVYMQSSSTASLNLADISNAIDSNLVVLGASNVNALGAVIINSGAYGVYVDRGSNVSLDDSSIDNATLDGIRALEGSIVNASNATITFAGVDGIYAHGGSKVSADGVDVSDAVEHGVLASSVSSINMDNGIANRCNIGIAALRGSSISANSAVVTLCTSSGFEAYGGSQLNCNLSTSTGSPLAYKSLGTSVVNAHSSNGDGTDTTYYINDGGMMNLTDATGSTDTNTPVNAVTGLGILFA